MKKIIIAAGILILAVLGFILKTLRDAGELKTLHPHFAGAVSHIAGITGGEDISIDHDKRIAYISADDRFATLQGRNGFGGFYMLYLDSPGRYPALMKRLPENEIHPHGISLYQSPEGKSFLYAVNHDRRSHSILRYRINNDFTLTLEQAYSDSTFIISPNDVAAVDEHRFYFTNDHGSRSAWGKKLEDYLQRAKSNVVYFDGEKYSIAADKIAYANGINISADKREVYVAATIGKHILVYERDLLSGRISFKKEIHLTTGVDNIELDEHGNLWVACHPRLLTFVRHAGDTSLPAPSQVIKISRDGEGNFTAEEIYLNAGEEISASSVAAVSANIMLVGPVLENHILWCELP